MIIMHVWTRVENGFSEILTSIATGSMVIQAKWPLGSLRLRVARLMQALGGTARCDAAPQGRSQKHQ